MKRDTYHNYVTGLQMMERRITFDEVAAGMWRSSGLAHISNRGIIASKRFDVDAVEVTVFADSAGWTGR